MIALILALCTQKSTVTKRATGLFPQWCVTCNKRECVCVHAHASNIKKIGSIFLKSLTINSFWLQIAQNYVLFYNMQLTFWILDDGSVNSTRWRYKVINRSNALVFSMYLTCKWLCGRQHNSPFILPPPPPPVLFTPACSPQVMNHFSLHTLWLSCLRWDFPLCNNT